MLKKLTGIVLMGAMSMVLIGCDKVEDAGGIADQAKAGVDSAADAAKDATDEMVPEGAKEMKDGAIDQGGEMAKDGIDKVAGGADE